MDVDEKSKPTKLVERAIIDEKHKVKLGALVDQANTTLQGIAIVTKSDIVNLILENHADTLGNTELEQLKALHLDQVKYAFWLAKRLKAAKASGQELSLQQLLAESQPVMTKSSPKISRTPRKKKVMVAQNVEPPSSTGLSD